MCLLTAVAGCSTTRVISIEDLIADGRANHLRAREAYDGKMLEVTGRIQHTGLQGSTVYAGTGTTTLHGRSTATTTIQMAPQRVEHPFVVLVPRPGSPYELLCYFTEYDRAKVADLKVGDAVVMRGVFDRYLPGTNGTLVPQLSSCFIPD